MKTKLVKTKIVKKPYRTERLHFYVEFRKKTWRDWFFQNYEPVFDSPFESMQEAFEAEINFILYIKNLELTKPLIH